MLIINGLQILIVLGMKYFLISAPNLQDSFILLLSIGGQMVKGCLESLILFRKTISLITRLIRCISRRIRRTHIFFLRLP